MPRRSRRRQTDVQLHIRLYPGQDDDLIDWLEQFDDRPYGVKTQVVKEVLQRGIESTPNPGAAPAVDLAEMRRVVEAAVETALSRFAQSPVPGRHRTGLHPGEGQMIGAAVTPSAEEDEATEELLDALGEALVLRSPGIQGKD